MKSNYELNLIDYVKKHKSTKQLEKNYLFRANNIKQKEDIKRDPNFKIKKKDKKRRCSSVAESNLKSTKTNYNNNHKYSSKEIIYLEPLYDNNNNNKVDKNDNNFINFENEIKLKKEKKEKTLKNKTKNYRIILMQLQSSINLIKKELNRTDIMINKYKKKCDNQEQTIKSLELILNEMKTNEKSNKSLINNDSINNINNYINDDSLFEEQLEEDFGIDAVEQQIMDDICPNPDAMTYEQLLQLEDNMGNVNKGLSIQQIQEIPIIKYRKYKSNGISQCIICMEEFEKREKVNLLPCQHIFHINCIKQWLLKQKTCPFCKKEIIVN